MARRVLGVRTLRALTWTAGTARLYGTAEIARRRLALGRSQTRARLFAVVCRAACAVTATETLTIGSRRHRLAAQRMRFAGAGAGVVALRIPSKVARALRRARRARLAVTLRVGRARTTQTIALTVRR
jgi:hypothetical protein